MECHSITECYHNLGTVFWRGLFVLCLVCFTSSLHTLECFLLQQEQNHAKLVPLCHSPWVLFLAAKVPELWTPQGVSYFHGWPQPQAQRIPLREGIKSQTKLLAMLGQHHTQHRGSLTEKHCSLLPLLRVVYGA